jgi:hypothetical protein
MFNLLGTGGFGKPNPNLYLVVFAGNRFPSFKSLRHNPRQHPTSGQLPRWGVDDLRDGGESVCHRDSQIIQHQLRAISEIVVMSQSLIAVDDRRPNQPPLFKQLVTAWKVLRKSRKGVKAQR